jgi:tetratricopeptide (TPR) repeat protein
MQKNDWYRKTTWTSDDAGDFFAHLERLGTDTHRAQYLKIQAMTLKDAEQYDVALELLELTIDKYPSRASAHVRKLRAECLWALGLEEQALEGFRAAFQAQREQRSIHCNVALSFAETFHDIDDGAHRAELLDLLREEIAQPESFGLPVYEFRYAVIFARLLAGLGDMNAAAKWAERALSAQRSKISGLRNNKSLDLVGRVDERTEIWLRQVAAWGQP